MKAATQSDPRAGLSALFARYDHAILCGCRDLAELRSRLELANWGKYHSIDA